jgi:hypothetical protein
MKEYLSKLNDKISKAKLTFRDHGINIQSVKRKFEL